MKKSLIFLALFALIFSSSAVFADNTGCGLGTMIFKGKKGKVYEILAVTTNGTSANQTFAITSGTLEYEEGASIAMNDVDQFVSKNMDYLAVDISRGNGEYLNTLAKLMKVKNNEIFNNKLKNNFNKIYTSENVTSQEIISNIQKISNS